MNYKDSNHKPEMAIALTQFEAMCGFRSISEIQHNIALYPELGAIIGSDALAVLSQVSDSSPDADKRNAVREIFCAFMRCENTLAVSQVSAAIERISLEANFEDDSSVMGSDSHIATIILRLHSDYPGDRGVFGPLFLNYICLQPGEAFFMGPNEPHAYLSGDCIECMALSDNVVRAGLTPKFKDVETLCGMLHYR